MGDEQSGQKRIESPKYYVFKSPPTVASETGGFIFFIVSILDQ